MEVPCIGLHRLPLLELSAQNAVMSSALREPVTALIGNSSQREEIELFLGRKATSLSALMPRRDKTWEKTSSSSFTLLFFVVCPHPESLFTAKMSVLSMQQMRIKHKQLHQCLQQKTSPCVWKMYIFFTLVYLEAVRSVYKHQVRGKLCEKNLIIIPLSRHINESLWK